MVLVHFALYISQEGYPGGLELSHTDKGVIFFVWAMAKNLMPLWSGGYAALNGTKKPLVIGSLVATIGYSLLFMAEGYWGVMISVVLMGSGLGAFQNALQTNIALSQRKESKSNSSKSKDSSTKEYRIQATANGDELNKRKKVIGWAGYQWTVNIAVLIGGFWSAKLIEGGIGNVFAVSTMIMLVVTAISAFIKSPANNDENSANNNELKSRKGFDIITPFRESFEAISRNPSILRLLISFSLFTFAYMQFYETLPNYLASYADSESLGALMKPLADFLGDDLGALGFRIEYLYNLNALVTLIVILPLSYLQRSLLPIKGYRIGLIVIIVGLLSLFVGNGAAVILLLFTIYTVGEAIVNPRILHVADTFSDDKSKKPVYLGLIYISWAFGLGFGGLIGGYVYDQFIAEGGLLLGYDPIWFWVLPIVGLVVGYIIADD